MIFRLAGFGGKKFKKWVAKGTGMSDGYAAKRLLMMLIKKEFGCAWGGLNFSQKVQSGGVFWSLFLPEEKK
ncbi:hypothetical protein QWY93_10655 [Echinicola jeungdonensis]|uniref:Uncharacterized protein n=1 Tax=Echinicola jeungdonensis TaxID=709343 RepID=A0ABV5J6I9_9BACT|nr:hypothetical protein [Echinicola jeungdonensis]MDN3669783.1 hypothetical protein [Echinicola jeungdonensis]